MLHLLKLGSSNADLNKHKQKNIMKTKLILSTVLSGLLFTSTFAQNPATRSEEVSEKCKQNNSIFYEFAKNQSYGDALAPWEQLYNDCPEYSKNIYKYGVLIIKWQLEQEKDEAKKAELGKKLMGVYDNRIKYFGDDATMPAARVLGLKAIDYYTISTPEDQYKKEAYKWLGQSINELGANADAAFLQYYIILSVNLYKLDANHLDQLVKDYIQTNDIATKNASDASNKYAKYYEQVKDANNTTIGASKALSMETLDKIYSSKVEENKSNLDYLNSVVGLYKTVGATGSEVYFKASVYVHNIKPSEESAAGCADMSVKKGEYAKAIDYLETATQLSTDNSKKANYQLAIATFYDKLGSFSKAREAARNSLGFNPNQGEPYLLIGSLYARSTSIYSDPVLSKTVYWAAVDKFIKAKQVDPSVASKATELINTYSRYFPEDNDIFMHPDLEKGRAYTVGGWIGETTTCR